MSRSIPINGVLLVLLLGSVAQAQTVRFLNPDDSPATSIRVFQTQVEYGGGGMGAMMGGGDGDEMDMMMEMMGGPATPARISFLNETPIGYDDHRVTSVKGEVNLGEVKDPKTHRLQAPLLALAGNGISFVPAGGRLQKDVQLRPMGEILVHEENLTNPDSFRVLACWQNGFAWPSQPTDDYAKHVKVANKKHLQDWRFQPRFQLYYTGILGYDYGCEKTYPGP